MGEDLLVYPARSTWQCQCLFNTISLNSWNLEGNKRCAKTGNPPGNECIIMVNEGVNLGLPRGSKVKRLTVWLGPLDIMALKQMSPTSCS